MATSTFAVDCPAGDWTPVAGGDVYASVTLQSAGTGLVAVIVGTNEPDEDAANFLYLPSAYAPLSLALASTDIAYCRPLTGGATMIRGVGVEAS